MPTRFLKRIWCKTCNNFTLHEFNKNTCNDCSTEYTSILLKDIPKEKLFEQRERYKKSNNVFSIYEKIAGFSQNMSMFDPPGSDIEIRESDAGQKSIDEANKRKREKELEERHIKRQEEIKLARKFKDLGRNDICLCGSGKKFKKCCWRAINKIPPE